MNINITDSDNTNLLSALISEITLYVLDGSLSLISKMFLITFVILFTLFVKTVKTIFYLCYIFMIIYILAWLAGYDLIAILSKLFI